jgi:hypothetical protein
MLCGRCLSDTEPDAAGYCPICGKAVSNAPWSFSDYSRILAISLLGLMVAVFVPLLVLMALIVMMADALMNLFESTWPRDQVFRS